MEVSFAQDLLDAVFERARTCTAGFHYQVGSERKVASGVLISHSGKTYVLTCEHVLSRVLDGPFGDLVVGAGRPIDRKHLYVVGLAADDDIAVAEIVVPLPSSVRPRDLSEFQLVDFRAMSVDRRGFAVVGFPAGLADASSSHVSLRPLVYMTVDSLAREQEETNLYLAYRESDSPLGLPKAYGLSGSSVLAFDTCDPGSEEIFRFGRIVAIQTAAGPAEEHEYLKCVGLRRLFEWLQ